MKKVIRLTESDLIRIVKQNLNEQPDGPNPDQIPNPVKYIKDKTKWYVDDSMKDYDKIFISNTPAVDNSTRSITIYTPKGGTKPYSISVDKKGSPTKKFTDLFSQNLFDKVIAYAKL